MSADGFHEFKVSGDLIVVLKRLDKVIVAALPEDVVLSRSRVQALVKGGYVQVNGVREDDISASVSAGDRVRISMPPPQDATPRPQNIPLNIVFEDEHMLVINKPAGLVVHPGAGNFDGTLVNALLYHCGGSLSGIGGVSRPGIVHRLDKDTSGLMVVAKHDKAHKGLSDQLQDRSLSRIYHALVVKAPVPPIGIVDRPLGRDPRHRQKMGIRAQGGKQARTHYKVIQDYGGALSLVECKLESGRTHQIRVHMQALGHGLIGDPLYGPQDTAVRAAMKKAGYEADVIDLCLSFSRQVLHAHAISFVHPITGERHSYQCDVPEDISELLRKI